MSRGSDEVTVSAWQSWSASHDALAAIAESATLAVDAKAKALKAAGEDVIGFGAGRARLPHARRDRRGRRSPPARIPRTTATRRSAACPSCAPRSSRSPSATRASSAPSRRCSSPTAASRRSTTRSRHCSTRATRCCSRRRTGRPIPSRSRSAAACRSWCRRPVRRASGSRSISSKRRAHTAHQGALFVSPSNPSGAVYPPAEVEAIGRWAAEKGIWVVTDEIYEHLTYGGHVFSSMPRARARARRPVRHRERRRQDLRDDRAGASAG